MSVDDVVAAVIAEVDALPSQVRLQKERAFKAARLAAKPLGSIENIGSTVHG